MIPYVASAGEDRGRVILQFDGAPQVSAAAVMAAVNVAAAFDSELELLFVEDRRIFDSAEFGFTRHIALSGRATSVLDLAASEAVFRQVNKSRATNVARLAATRNVPTAMRMVRDNPLSALAKSCSQTGPWNVIGLSAPYGTCGAPKFASLCDATSATGVIVAGAMAADARGPVAALIEEIEQLPAMLRAAERIASVNKTVVQLSLVSKNDADAELMQGQIRLALGEREIGPLIAVDLSRGIIESAAHLFCGMNLSLIIAPYGGRLIADHGYLIRFAELVRRPLFLVA